MKKDPKASRKLTLNRETLRSLEGEELREAAGAATTFCPSAAQECTVTRRDCF